MQTIWATQGIKAIYKISWAALDWHVLTGLSLSVGSNLRRSTIFRYVRPGTSTIDDFFFLSLYIHSFFSSSSSCRNFALCSFILVGAAMLLLLAATNSVLFYFILGGKGDWSCCIQKRSVYRSLGKRGQRYWDRKLFWEEMPTTWGIQVTTGDVLCMVWKGHM